MILGIWNKETIQLLFYPNKNSVEYTIFSVHTTTFILVDFMCSLPSVNHPVIALIHLTITEILEILQLQRE